MVIILIALGLGGLGWGIKRINGRPAVVEVPQKPVLKFAVMSDIHSDWANFRKALGLAKNNQNKFVILTGDLTTIGKKTELAEAKKILDESDLLYFVIPGNHDLWYGNQVKAEVFNEVFGESYLSFKDEGIKFILFNNGDYYGVEDLAWLKLEIEECLKVTCLVFSHMPLNHPKSSHIMGEDNARVASQAAELKGLFKQAGVKAFFAGHLHYFSQYELDGLTTTVTGAISAERNLESPKFLEVTAEGSSWTAKEVFLVP